MDVGMMLIFSSYGWEGGTDSQMWEEELRLAEVAADSGFDCLWSAEHHFNDYSFVPDNIQLMTHLATKHPDIDVGTAAVILPWHNPLRVAENAAVLDLLSNGRLRLGFGRGLARREFEVFQLSMDESRERFDEAAPMVLDALESGWMDEHEGKYFRQKRVPLRPAPTGSFRGRSFQVAMSSESAEQAARLGLPMMAFSIKDREQEKQEFEIYREHFRNYNDGAEAPTPFLADLMICDSDAGRAQANAERYCAGYLQSVLRHYELMSDHFDKVGGYDAYGQNAEVLRQVDLGEFTKAYIELQSWGTPDQMLRKFEKRRELFGEFGILGIFRFAGLPLEDAQRSMDLFSKEVMPVLRSWEVAAA